MKKLLFLFVVAAAFVVTTSGVMAGKPDEMPEKAQKDKQECMTIQSGDLYGSDGSLLEVGFNQWGYNYQGRVFNGSWCDYHPVYRSGGADYEWCQENMVDVELSMKWNDAWLSNKSCDGDDTLDRHSGYPTYSGSGAWLTNHERGTYNGEWSIVGDWILDFDWNGGSYVHDMTIVDNTFTGTGAAQFSSQTWTVTGTIVDDNVEMLIDYDNSPYFVDVVGTISGDGVMSGTWSNNSQSGTWLTSSGMAMREVCDYNYFVKIVAPPIDAHEDGGIWYTADGSEIGLDIWGAFAITQEVSNDSCAGDHGLLYKGTRPGLGNW